LISAHSLHEIPLSGLHLIEASAGTGKTTALTILFLRALLEGTPIDRILVVTFTEAATEEVKGRIHGLLRNARSFSLGTGPQTKDSLFLDLLVRPDHAEILSRGLSDLDRAPVMTIHSFCRRLLREYAFEFETPFSLALETDDENLLSEAVREVWRRRVYPADRNIALFMLALFPDGPQSLKALLRSSDRLLLEEGAPFPGWGSQEREYLELLDRCRKIDGPEIEKFIRSWPSGPPPEELKTRRRKLRPEDPHYWKPEEILERILEICSGMPDPPPGFLAQDQVLAEVLEKARESAHSLSPILRLVDGMGRFSFSLRESVKHDLLSFLRTDSLRERERRGIETFDDMIFRVHEGLMKDRSEELARKIRTRYPIAFVDEFQDTDIGQYRIFDRIYRISAPPSRSGDAGGALFLVGDPKQSIYRFRGADIRAYLEARRSVLGSPRGHFFSLTVNYRSDHLHVEAVNRLFSLSPDPFLTGGEIPWSPTSPNHSGTSAFEDPDRETGIPRPPVLFLSGGGEGETTLDHFADLCAREVGRLLSSPVRLEGRRVRPGEIAVLVRKHSQGDRIQEALKKRGIPSVASGREGVLESEDAAEFEGLLLALSNPGDRRQLRSVLVSSLFGTTAPELLSLEGSQELWDLRTDPFFRASDGWARMGAMGSLRRFFLEEGIFSRLGQGADGRRRITNFLHLFEILEDLGRDRCPLILLADRYIEARQEAQLGKGDKEVPRLDSHESRVKIVTLHKSKGLEFPIVLLPFGLPVQGRDDRDDQEGGESEEEVPSGDEAEEMRLLYVSLTRAVHRTSLLIPTVRQNQRALVRLLDLPPGLSGSGASRGFRERIGELVRANPDLFGMVPEGDREERPPTISPEEQEVPGGLRAREISRAIPAPRSLESFTSLSRSLQDERDGPEKENRPLPEEVRNDPEKGGADEPVPAGPLFGTFFHRIMEVLASTNELQGSPPSRDRVREIASGALLDVGAGQNPLCRDWPERVLPLVDRTLGTDLAGRSAPFPGTQAPMTLLEIFGKERSIEREFLMPVHRLAPGDLETLLLEAGPRLSFDTVSGYLRGFVDLIFRFGERFYLLDYKTNLLQDTGQTDPYGRVNLERVMAEHRYDLQGLIYCLALHRLLSVTAPGYDYERHFGGIYFLFVRGLSPGEPESGRGIYHDRPSREKIGTFDRFLQGDTE
jgi:exodeoxyribonuclease V beta subunit